MPQSLEFPNLGTVELPDEFSLEKIQGMVPGLRTRLLQEREQAVAAETATQPGGGQNYWEQFAAPLDNPGDYFGIGDALAGKYRAIKRGQLRGQQGIEALDADISYHPPTMREERVAHESAMLDPRRYQGTEELDVAKMLAKPFAGGTGVEPYWKPNARLERIVSPEAKLDMMVSPREAARIAALRDVAETEKKIQAIPRSEAMSTLGSDFWGTLKRHPIETMAEVASESLPQSMLPALIPGRAVPMAISTLVNSTMTDYAAGLLESARDVGVDLTDEAQLNDFFTNPAKLRAARANATKHAVPVGVFDEFSAIVAGRILGPQIGRGVARTLAAGVADLVATQMLPGMAGETVGQIMQSGKVTSLPDIVLEGIGELPTYGHEAFGNIRDDIRKRYEMSPEGKVAKVAKLMDQEMRRTKLPAARSTYALTRTLREPRTQIDTGPAGAAPGATVPTIVVGEGKPETLSPQEQARQALQRQRLSPLTKALEIGAPVTATLENGTTVTGVVIGADPTGNAVVGTEGGGTVTLPEKLEGGPSANSQQVRVEIPGREPSAGTAQNAAGQPGGLQPPPGQGGPPPPGLPPQGGPPGPTPPPAPGGATAPQPQPPTVNQGPPELMSPTERHPQLPDFDRDTATASETVASIVARTKVGDERDAAFSERRAAAVRLANTLRPGDTIVDSEGEVGTVEENLGNGQVFLKEREGQAVDAALILIPDILTDASGVRQEGPAGKIVRGNSTANIHHQFAAASGHKNEISRALTDRKPVNAEAVEAYGMTNSALRRGYVREGDRYVYKPAGSQTSTTTAPQPTPPTVAPPVSPPVAPKIGPGPPDWITEGARQQVQFFQQTNPDLLEELTNLHAQDLSARQIAERLKITEVQVRWLRIGLGLPDQGKGTALGSPTGNAEDRRIFEEWRDTRNRQLAEKIKAGTRKPASAPPVYKARMLDIDGTPTDWDVQQTGDSIQLWKLSDGKRTGAYHQINLPAEMSGQTADPVKFQELLNSGLQVAYVTTPERGTVTTLVRAQPTTSPGPLPAPAPPTTTAFTPEQQAELDELLKFQALNKGKLGKTAAAKLAELQALKAAAEAPTTAPTPSVITEADVTRKADEKGVKWDDDPAFLSWTERLTGIPKLENLNPAQLQTVYDALERGERPKPAKSKRKDSIPATTLVNEGGVVETWYDRNSRNWVTQHNDDQGNQIGAAVYTGNAVSAQHAHDQMVKDQTKPEAPTTKPPKPAKAPAPAPGPTTKPPATPPTSEQKIANLDAERDALLNELRGLGSQLGSGVDPQYVVVLGKLIVNRAKVGIIRFKDFIRDLREKAPDIWKRLKDLLYIAWTNAADEDPALEPVTRPQAVKAVAEVEAETSLEGKVDQNGHGKTAGEPGGGGGNVPPGTVPAPAGPGGQPGGGGGGGGGTGQPGTAPGQPEPGGLAGAGGPGISEGPPGALGGNVPGGASAGVPGGSPGLGTAVQNQPGRPPGAGRNVLQSAGTGLSVGRKLNTRYVSVSKNVDPGLVVPSNLADPMRFAILDLERQVGMPVDLYVSQYLDLPLTYRFVVPGMAPVPDIEAALRQEPPGGRNIVTPIDEIIAEVTGQPATGFQPTALLPAPAETLVPPRKIPMRATGVAGIKAITGQFGLYDAMSSAQIESTALAIRNIERGSALINGAMTGVGKGRTVAAVIKYLRSLGKIPVFVTAKPSLYTDMVSRDMVAIGMDDFVPFITNKYYKYKNGQGETISSFSNKDDELEAIAKTGQLPEGTHAFFTTYDQLADDVPDNFKETNREKRQRQKNRQGKPDGRRWAAMRALAPNAVFILDEAHRASGEASELNIKFQDEILPLASGNYLSTATFAKTADNLGLYAAVTLMRKIGRPQDVGSIISDGGNPMYQANAAMLASSGEFVRYEQDYDGVDINFVAASTNPEKEVENADTYSSYLGELRTLFDQVNEAAQKLVDRENQQRPGKVKLGFQSIGLGERLFNLSQQYILSLKTPATVARAIQVLNEPALNSQGGQMFDKAGRPLQQKPFISLYNTMEGPINDLVQRKLPLTFNGILMREMQKALEITIKDPTAPDRKRKETLAPEDLPDGGQFYYRLQNQILATDLGDFPISPIDYMLREFEKSGIKAAEITDRAGELKDTGEVQELTEREKVEREKILEQYNDGRLDVVIVNGASAEGVSAHTDPKFPDQRRRVMIVAQPQRDVTQMMQMLGRVMRFGQTSLPKFIFLSTTLAAEKRFMTMQRTKLESLNANTSADTESSYTLGGLAENIFNPVGDEVVYHVLSAEPEAVALAGIPMPSPGPNNEVPSLTDFARKSTGWFVLLPDADARRIWASIDEAYVNEIRLLDQIGENPLRATPEDLRAETLETTEFTHGTGNTLYDGPSMLEKANTQVTHRPMTYAEARAMAEANDQSARSQTADWIELNQEAERTRLAAATERGATEKQLADIKNRFQHAREQVSSALTRLGRTYGFDPTGNGRPQMYVVVANMKLAARDVVDLGSPSKQDLILVSNTARPIINLAISKAEGPENYLTDPAGDAAELFDSTAEKESVRYIVTGNVVAGFGQARNAGRGAKARVVMFTRDDGTVHTGVLMPVTWKPGDTVVNPHPPVANADEFNRLAQALVPVSATKYGKNGTIYITNHSVSVPASNEFRTVWGNKRYQQFVPYSQKVGPNLVGTLSQSTNKEFYDYLAKQGFRFSNISGVNRTSLKPDLGPGMEAGAVRAAVSAVAPNAPVEVSDEDPPVRNGMRIRGLVRQDGSIILYSKALDSVGETRAVLFEELGHLVARDPEYVHLYQRLVGLITPAEIQAMVDLGYSQNEAAEEAVMRRLVEAEQNRSAENAFTRAWKDLMEWMTRFLRQWGVMQNEEYDLREMVRATIKVGAFPDVQESYSAKPHTATPVPEPKTTRIRREANMLFDNRSQIEKQMFAEGLLPAQKEIYRSVGLAQAGLIPSESGDVIKRWSNSNIDAEKIAARTLKQVEVYLDMKNTGEEDPAIVPAADGFTVVDIQSGERSDAANGVLYTHENLKRMLVRLNVSIAQALKNLQKAVGDVQSANINEIPQAAASNLASDAIKAFEASIAAEIKLAGPNLVSTRRDMLGRIAADIQRTKDDLGSAITVALKITAERMPENVLRGTSWVTDAGGEVPANTPGSVTGSEAVRRWIKGQTLLKTPVAGEEAVNWLTTAAENGRTPLSYARDLLGRLAKIREIIANEADAIQDIKDAREFFKNNSSTQNKGPVTAKEFAKLYFRWESQRRKATETMKTISGNLRSATDAVTGFKLALAELERIQKSAQYNAALRAAMEELDALRSNTYGITTTGRIYYPEGPLSGQEFINDDSRLIDYTPSPIAIQRNVRNVEAMATAIDNWVNGPGKETRDPAELRAWAEQLNWIRAHAMLDVTQQWNYAKLGMGHEMIDLRPFGYASRIMLNLGMPGPPQGLKNFLPGIAQHELTRTEHRHAQVVTELDNLMRDPHHGWHAVMNAIIEGAASHGMGERDETIVQQVQRFPTASSKAAMSDDIYLTYIPQYLSEIYSRNQAYGDILIGVGDLLSNDEIVTEADMKAVRLMKKHLDEFYKVLQENKSFIENKEEPLLIRDEATNVFRKVLHSNMLLRMRRSQSHWGQTFAEGWKEALEKDALHGVTSSEMVTTIPNENRMAFFNEHIRVLNDYVMTTNPEFVNSGFFLADEITKRAHRKQTAEWKAKGRKADRGLFKTVEEYLDWIAQEHVDNADPAGPPPDFATERAKAEEALFDAFDAYTKRFAEQSLAEKIENEAESVVSIANNPVGPLTRPRKQMVAPNYFYNYAVATKADYGFLRAKAFLPHLAQVAKKMEAIHAGLVKERDRRVAEQRKDKKSQEKYPTTLRMLSIATRMVGEELTILQTNIAQTTRTIYDNDALSLAQRIEETLSMGLLAAVSPTLNNVFTALAGQAFMGVMAGRVSHAIRFPLTLLNLHKRVLRFLLTGGGNKRLALYIGRHRNFFGRMTKLMMRMLIEEEMKIQEYRARAGIPKVQGVIQRMKALRANPDMYGEDFGPHRSGAIQKAINRVLASVENVPFTNLPMMAGIRDWTSYIDSKTVAGLGYQFEAELDRMKNAILEAMAKRADGSTPTQNFGDLNKVQTPFTPKELGLNSYKELEWFKQQLRPAGSLEYLALRYWNKVKDLTPGTAQLDVPFASPEEWNSMFREYIRMSGNPADAMNRITRHKPAGVLRVVQQFWQRFQQWNSNYASALNRAMTLDSRDAVKDNAMFYGRAMMLLLALVGGSMWWNEEKAEVQKIATGRDPSLPRASSVQDVGDFMRYAVASVTPTILPYYGEAMSRMLGGTSSRPLFDLTAAIPAANFTARFFDMIPKIVQSRDPFFPIYDFVRQSFPIIQIPLHVAAQFSPLLLGEERAAAAAAAVRSAAPSDMEKTAGGGGRGGTLTPMSAFVRRAVDYAYAGDEARAREQIEKAVQYQMSRGKDEKTARRIVNQSLVTRVPTRRVVGRLITEPEEVQLTSRMTGSQQAAYGHAGEAFRTLGAISGSRMGLAKGQRFTRSRRGAGLGGSSRTRSLSGRRSTGTRSRSLASTRRRTRNLASNRRSRSLIV